MSIGSMNNLSLATAKPVITGSRATPSKPGSQTTAKSGFGSELSRVHDIPTRGPVQRDERDSRGQDEKPARFAPTAAKFAAPVAKTPVVKASAAPVTKANPSLDKQDLDIDDVSDLEISPDLNAATDVENNDDAEMELDPRFANVQFAMPNVAKPAAKLPPVGPLGQVQAPAVEPKVATANPGIEFLRKMKETLGVSGEEVVTAFAQLSDEDLAQPPAATVDKIVAGLGLNDQQSALAKQFFNKIIEQTKTQDLGEDVKAPVKSAGMDLLAKLETPRQSPTFVKPPETAPPEVEAEVDDDAPAIKGFSDEIPEDTAPVAAPIAKSSPAMEKAVAQMRAADDAPIADRAIEKLVNSVANPMKAKAANFAAAASQVAPTASTTVTAPSAPTLSAQTLNGMISKMRDQDASTDDQGEPSDEAQVPFNAFASDAQVGKETKSSGDFQTQLNANAAKSSAPVTVPELMQNAKIMIKEGGGEMKVTMHPEGMGEVELKVSVENGKVNVTMLTQTDEVKHLIERQLGELKASLSSTHLQPGEIKVDSASQTNKHLDQNFQDNSRQQAQANLEQFRQDTQSGRRGYNQTESRYGRASAGAPSVNPMMTAGAPRPSDSSRRLNLVA